MATQIALIKVGALGDVVRTTCLLPALKHLYPAMELTWITGKEAFELVEGNPYATRVVKIDDPPEAAWRHQRYDWVISLDDDEELCGLASALNTLRLTGGYATGGERRYSADIEPWFGMGLLRPASAGGIDRANELKRANTRTYGELLYSCLGLSGPIARPFIKISAEQKQTASEWMTANGVTHPLIALNTGAGTRWRFKSWGEDQTVALAREVVDRLGASVVILGGPSEKDRNQRIVDGVRLVNVRAARTDLDFVSFAALIGQCDLLITSDSLGLHLATAQQKPIIALFGPTSAAEIDLYGLGEKLITPLECRTCYLRTCDVRPHCMQSIPVERVLAATQRQLHAHA